MVKHIYSPTYYQLNKEEIKEKRRLYRKEHKEKINQQQKMWYRNGRTRSFPIKVEVLTHYGNGKLACVRCGYDNILALTLDHIIPIQGNRKHSGVGFYKYLRKLGYPSGLQTLCANCQMLKMFEGNEWNKNT